MMSKSAIFTLESNRYELAPNTAVTRRRTASTTLSKIRVACIVLAIPGSYITTGIIRRQSSLTKAIEKADVLGWQSIAYACTSNGRDDLEEAQLHDQVKH